MKNPLVTFFRSGRLYFVISLTIFLCLFRNEDVSGQNVIPNAAYCNTDTPVQFYISAPGNKTWTCSVPGVVVNIGGGRCTFSPASVPGPFPRTIRILYQNQNYVGEPAAAYDEGSAYAGLAWSVEIRIPPVVTFAPIASVCQTDANFPLAPRGNPVGGTYTGPGVAAGFFSPAAAGPGTHILTYTYPSAGCSGIAYQTVTVQAIPVVTLPPFADVCIDATPFPLSTGSPLGGTYSGTGVVAGVFDPAAAGIGIHTITYSYTSGLCTNFTTQQIRVNPLPVVSIGGLLPKQCDTELPYTITGFPTGANGTFTGSGITDNLNGTAIFNPGTSGLGFHNIIYSYTDAKGCKSSNTQLTRVGTEIFINGLASQFCSGDAAVNFTYSPFSGDPLNGVSGSGVTDLGGGNAIFDPAAAGVGNNVITYVFWDDIGCKNKVTQTVTVDVTPNIDFSGLNASYCSGSADGNLKGSLPGGIFTGPAGSVVDLGGGNAIFKPSALATGSYTITYTYTNTFGCTDILTKNVDILPLPTAFNVTGGGSRCELAAGIAVGLANSTTGINYRLYRDGLPLVPDNTQPGSTGNPVSFGNQTLAGTYTVMATNAVTGCINAMNGNAVITVVPQIAITTQPTDATTCEDGSVSFTVQATGPNRHYQWYNNAVAVGADNNVLVLNPVPLTDDGHEIYCVVTSTTCGGPITSSKAILSVNPVNKIVTNPVSAVKCTGSNVNFSVVADGLNRTYKWKKGAADVVDAPGKISGSTTSVLSISNLVAADAGLYSCEVSGDCGIPVTSTQATLTVNDPIVITTQPASVTACAGTNTSFNTVVTPAAGLTYQWFFNNGGGDMAIGPNSPTLGIAGAGPANVGNYYCRISNACGAFSTTNVVTLKVPVTTSITIPPVGDVVCEGSNLNLTVTAVGENLAYQWFRDANPLPLTDNAVIHNSTTSTLAFTGLTPAYTGNYRVKVTGTCGDQTSAPDAIVSVRQHISITAQPAGKTVCSGSDATFTVAATGDDLSYQWQFNNVNIPLATSSDYTITGATVVNAGNYRCVVSSIECGVVNSSEATLTINPVTAIVTHPVLTKSACSGSNVSFSVVASGVGLAYQWYKDMAILAGYTASTINLNNISAADAGSYTCRVTGTCGTVVSNPGVLSVDIPVVISTHPVSASVCLNDSYDLSVVLSAGTSPTYQWYFDNGVPAPIAGANGQIYTVSPFNAGKSGDYYCVVTNGCGSVNSQKAKLTLINAFNITTPLSDVSVCENGSTTFTIVADQPALSYQWMKNGADIAGATLQSLIVNNIPFADNGAVYSCRVWNSCITRIDASTVTVSKALSITQQPQGGIACPGSNFSINVMATGTNPQYQWYKAPATLLAGRTASVLSFTPFAPADAGTYYCVITNSCGSVNTNNAVITAGTTTAITTNPSASNLCIGEDAVFTVSATGTNLTYEWRKNFVPLADDGRIVGSGTNTLTINNVVAGDEQTYDVIVTGTCGLAVTSAGAFLDITTPPVISVNPVPRTVCSGGNASFSVTVAPVAGDPVPSYQWQENNFPINPAVNPSAATSTLNLTGVLAGGIYNCVVTNSCGFVTSTSAELKIEQNVSVTSQPAPLQTKCQGSNVTITAAITGPTNMTLQWYKDGGALGPIALVNDGHTTGVDLPTLTIINIVAADQGSYYCVATSSCGNTPTNIAVLNIQDRIFITQQPQSITVCPAGTLTLNVVATGTVTNYQWKYFDGTSTVNVGTNDPAYSVSPFNAAAHAGTYTCEITNICETVVSDAAIVSGGTPTTATISADLTRCEGQNASFTVTTTGSNLTYKWYHGGTVLSDGGRIGGSLTKTLTISSLLPADDGTYQCDVSGNCGFDNDNSAVLTVNRNISFDVQPVSTSALIGTTATFTIVASGNITGYQWYKGATLLVDAAGDISGATTPVLSLINAQPVLDEGAYSCVILGPCGNRTSNSANLTVIPASVITAQPVTPINVCEGLPFAISITTTAGVHTYQWKRNTTNLTDDARITGSATASLNVSAAVAGDAGAYTCLVDGIETSSPSILTVNPSTVITLQPAGGTKCAGDMHVFSVAATGANLTYQWYKNNLASPVAGAIADEYTISPVSVADNGTYFCVVTGTCGPQTSNPAALVVNNPVSIVAQPAPLPPICEGSSASMTFNVTGIGLTYTWKKNGQPITDPNVSGINTGTLVISNSVLTNAGVYSCTVTGACSAPLTSNNVTLTVNQTTSITTQPVGRIKCEGDVVTFTISATGTGLTYDWRFNGVSLGLPSNPFMTIAGLTDANEGTYTCVVTGGCGVALISDPAVLTVNRNTAIGIPAISVNPICENGSTSISIAATGDGLIYLWQKNGMPIAGANITGVTSSALVISNALPADAGVYTCTVTGLCGSPLTSVNAVLDVNPTTNITMQPANNTRCAGDEALFTVQATGNIATYQWHKGGAAGPVVTDGIQASGAVISGSMTYQLRITGVTPSEAGSYTCVITGSCGNINTIPATLTVNVPVQITAGPPLLTQICQGSSTTISVTTSGTVTSFKWKKDGAYLSNGGNIAGADAGTLVISNALSTDAGFYSCEISGPCNILNSQPSELKVNPAVAITLQPSGATLCEGENVQFMVTASGTAPLSYQWKLNNVDLPGETSSTLIINGLQASDAGAYTCLVSGAALCGTATSNPANLVVNPGAKITTQPVNTTVCAGSTAIISVASTGTAPLSYRWKLNDVYMADGGRISGTSTSELRIALTSDADEGIYKCEVSSPCGTEVSSSVTLTVDAATVITIHPASQTIVQGSNAVFSVAASGIIIGYQWEKDGAPLADGGDISGATTAMLSVATVAVTDAGSYRCVVTGKCGILTSNPGILTVNVPVIISSSPVDLTKCTGESASFTFVASGSILSYQWTFNGVSLNDAGAITGSHTPNLVISSVAPAHEGNYACIVTGSSNIANSAVASLTVNEPAVITTQPLSQTLCPGDWLVLEVTASGEALSYAWEKDGVPLVADANTTGINSSLLVITNVTVARAGSYRCVISNSCKTENSNAAVIVINPTVTIITQPAGSTKCEGQTTSFSVTAGGVSPVYQWYKNGAVLANSSRITGATTRNLTITNIQSSDEANYSCTVSDNCVSVNSTAVNLDVKEVVAVSSQPSNLTVCEGQNAFFEVTATGFNLSYQWLKDGAPLADGGKISGATSSVLVITNPNAADRGVYRCNITGDCNIVLSNPASLSVNLLPAPAGAVTGTTLLCQGSRNILYVVPAIANATSYVWTLPYGATIVSGAGTRSIEVDFLTGSLSGVVSVHGINACADGAESAPLAVTVNAVPLATAGPDQILCTDATTLAGNVTAFGTWTKLTGQATIVNPTNPVSSLTGIGQGTNTFLWTVTESGCTARDTVTIINRKVYVDAGIDQTICSLTTKLTANTPSSGIGNWSIVSGGGAFSSMSDPKATVINLTRGGNILRWSINNGGCVSSDDVLIRNDLPTNSDAGKDTILLVDNYTLAGNNPAIGTGQWSLVSGSGTITNPSQYNSAVTGLGIGENILQWTITNNLCYSQDQVKVVNYTLTNTDAGPNQTLCTDHTILAGTKPNYGTGQWSVIAGSAKFVDPSKYDTEVINIGKGQNIYRWTIYEYKITFDDVVITNNSPSTANAGIDQRLCLSDAVISANNPIIGTGLWTVIGGAGNVTNPSSYNSTVTNLGSGSNTFRWTVSFNGCTSYDEVVVTNDQPTFADAGTDQVTCADSINLYPNTPTIGIGEWSVIQGSAFFSGNKAYNLSRGTNRIKWTITNNGCYHSDTVVVVSNKPTTAYTGQDRSVCVDSMTLPGNAPTFGTGVWTMLSGSGNIANINDPASMIRNLASGQNRLRWTITYNGCVSYSEVNIDYNFIQADAGSDQVLCQTNAFLSANDAGIGTGQWSIVGGSGSANFVNPNQSNTQVMNLDRGVNILRWTIVNSGCVSTDNVLITNNTPTTAFAGSDRSVCGEEIYLNANTPTIGTAEWSLLSGSARIESPTLATTKVSNLSIGRNVLRWTVTNQGCISFDEVVINNDQPSNIEAGPSQYICANTAQLYATIPAGAVGRWSILQGSATFENNTLYNTRISNLAKGENKLIWTVTMSGCSNSDSVIIANNLPSTPNAGPDQDVCADNVFMAANQASIGTGTWSVVSGSATFENRNLPGSKATAMGNGPNVLRWTITNGSCTMFDEVTIQNSLPTIAYAGEDRAVCNTAANLLATNPVSGTGSWSVVSGYGVFNDPKLHDAQITQLGFGQNTLRWTTENGRCRTSDDVIITNNLADVYAGPDQIVYNSTARIIGNKPVKGTGSWLVTAGKGTLANASSFETTVTGLGGGANTLTWTIDNDGCIATDDVVVTNRILPVADFSMKPGIGCPPLDVSFTNTSVGGAPFTWNFGDGTTSSSSNTTHTYTVPGTYTVRLNATGPDGIIVHKDTVVVVRQMPVAQFEVTPNTAFIPGNPVHYFNLSTGIDSLLWEFGDGTTSKNENPTYSYQKPGSYDVTLHVWSGFQCYDSLLMRDAVKVELAGVIKCPNAFTPNPNGPAGGNYNPNDFSNDVFHCLVDGAATYHLEIYNRLGIRLFESNDINIGWDGYYKGKLVESGAYVFRVNGKFNNGAPFSYFGNIVVIR